MDQRYVNQTYEGPKIVKGYLKKLKCDMAVTWFLKKFNKRFFVLNLHEYYFSYQSKEGSRNGKKYSLEGLTYFNPDPLIVECCEWKFAFLVVLSGREFFLHCETSSAHALWCAAFGACLKTKTQNLVQEDKKEPKNLLILEKQLLIGSQKETEIVEDRRSENSPSKISEKEDEKQTENYKEEENKVEEINYSDVVPVSFCKDVVQQRMTPDVNKAKKIVKNIDIYDKVEIRSSSALNVPINRQTCGMDEFFSGLNEVLDEGGCVRSAAEIKKKFVKNEPEQKAKHKLAISYRPTALQISKLNLKNSNLTNRSHIVKKALAKNKVA